MKFIGLGMLVAGVLMLAVVVTGIVAGEDNCVVGAQDLPPPGAITPNPQQLAEWPSIRDARLQGGLIAGQPAAPTIPAGFTQFPWVDPQPASDLGGTVGGSAVLLRGEAPCA